MLRREPQRFLDEGHVKSIFTSRAPSRASLRRADVAAVQLFDERFVEHGETLAAPRRGGNLDLSGFVEETRTENVAVMPAKTT